MPLSDTNVHDQEKEPIKLQAGGGLGRLEMKQSHRTIRLETLEGNYTLQIPACVSKRQFPPPLFQPHLPQVVFNKN